MIKINGTFLKHKIARQLFFLFLLSALVPTSILGLYTLNKITQNTTDGIQRDLRQQAKKFGLSMFGNIELLDQKLLLHINELSTSDDSKIYHLSKGLTQLYRVETSADYALDLFENTIEPIASLPVLNQEQLAILELGYPVITMKKEQNLPLRIYLIRKPSYTKDLIIGVLDNSSLWGHRDTFDDSRGFCIYGEENQPFFCSQSAIEDTLYQVRSTLQDNSSGNAEAISTERELYVGFWSLFLEPSFHYPKLIIAITADKKHSLEPIKSLRDTFLIMSLLTIICIALLSIVQIRKYLAPLESLLLGITRIAKNDFSQPISVQSDDEFTQLAESFNSMSDKISQQFIFLTTLSKIDQLILESTTVKDIVKAIISLANTAVESKATHIGMYDSNELNIHSEDVNHIHGSSIKSYPISQEEIDLFKDQKTIEYVRDGYNTILPIYLPSCGENCCYILVPIVLKNTLTAVLIFQYIASHVAEGTHLRLRELGDRFAIALEKSEWESQLYQKAHHDPLTQLPNRQLLNDRLDQMVKHSAREHDSFSLMFIDLDRFKTVNDSLGHTAGDELLIEVSERLLQVVNEENTVARLGGDEFIIVVAPEHDQGDNLSQVSFLAQKILSALSTPFRIKRNEIHIAASIGISIYPNDGDNKDRLIQNADSAMYFAKSKGRNNFQFYSEDFNKEASRVLVIETGLHRALDNDEFELYYQPKVDCKSGKILGAEALIRWNHPTEGLISPFHFIPIAEENGFINKIGEWTLKEACRQTKVWQEANFMKIKMSVNISPKQFQQQNLVALVKETLSTEKLEAHFLDLEIVESAAMHDIKLTIATIKNFKDLGVSISIDDYGTGFSTLSYLKKFPVDVLKIDREFIINLENDSGDKAIVSSTILLAHKLGLSVVAEGVEDEAQLAILRSFDCDEIQGYFFSRPLPASEFEQLLINEVISP